MAPLKDILIPTIKKLGIQKGIDENKAVNCWAEVVGKNISDKSIAIKIIKGTLYIKTKSPVWSQQLSFMSDDLRKKINDHLGREVVKQLRFRS